MGGFFQRRLSWVFDVRNGYGHGKEIKFYDSGEWMEENDVIIQ